MKSTFFGIKKKGKPVIKCDKCNRILKTKPRWKTVDGIEYCYMKCSHCEALYVISATDEALRQDMKRFTELTSRAGGRQPTVTDLCAALKLLQANVKRSKEIKAQYPLEAKLQERQG